MERVGAGFGAVCGHKKLLMPCLTDSFVLSVFELYESLTSLNEAYTYDLYTYMQQNSIYSGCTRHAGQDLAVGITHELAAVDKNNLDKANRERLFPLKLTDFGVSFKCVDGEASVKEDRDRILGEIGDDVVLLDELVHAVVAQAALERVLKEGGDRQASYLQAIRRGKQLRLDLTGSQSDTQDVVSMVVDELAITGACQRLILCTALSSLPDSIDQHNALQKLNLAGCSRLRALPDSIGQLNALQELDLTGCSGLRALPDSIAAFYARFN